MRRPYCVTCRLEVGATYHWAEGVDAALHLKQECAACRRFIQLVPQEPEYLRLAPEKPVQEPGAAKGGSPWKGVEVATAKGRPVRTVPVGRRKWPQRPVEYEEIEDCIILRVTAKAVQIQFDGDTHWVPKSVIKDPDDLRWAMAGVTLEVADWFARKELI